MQSARSPRSGKVCSENKGMMFVCWSRASERCSSWDPTTFRKRSPAIDHWHRTESDPGKPYAFKDADTLLQDFFREVRRVLNEHGVSEAVVRVEEGKAP